MAALSAIITIIALLMFFGGVLGLVSPRLIKQESRKEAGMVIVISIAALIVSSWIAPEKPASIPPKPEAPKIAVEQPKPTEPKPIADETKPTPLKFDIENYAFSDGFKFELSLVKVTASVSGGNPAQWVATAASIAKVLGDAGITTVEVTITNADVKQEYGIGFRTLANVTYSPDPSHTLYGGNAKWSASSVTKPSTQHDVDVVEEYNRLAESLAAKSPDTVENNEKAHEQAAQSIIKKYGLPKDWIEPVGNDTSQPFDVEKMDIDWEANSSMLGVLGRCVKDNLDHKSSSCQ